MNNMLPSESAKTEYKREVPSHSKAYMRTVIAFANTNGGTIVFGVNDDRSVAGIDPDNVFILMDSITNAIADNCTPAILPELSLQTIDGKTVIVLDIPASPARPYFLTSEGIVDGTYVRVAATTRHAGRERLAELILQGSHQHFDEQPCLDLNPPSEEEIERLCSDLRATALKNTNTDEEKAATREVTKNTLLSWGILKERQGRIIPTNAFALLTGKMQKQPVLQCGIFKGVDRAYFVDRREFIGPIHKQVEAGYQYVLEKINLGMRIHGIYREDVYELPIGSIRELIANAMVHRSYLAESSVQILLFDDRLEVISPGALIGDVTIEKMLQGYSKFRNPALATAFAYMRIIEKWGTGIPRLLHECKAYHLPAPNLIDAEGDFRVMMYRSQENGFTTRSVASSDAHLHSGGTTQVPDATTQAPNGTIQAPGDTIQAPDGTTQAPDATIHAPDGERTTICQSWGEIDYDSSHRTGMETDRPRCTNLSPFTEKDREVMALLVQEPKMSQQDLSRALGWTLSSVKYYLRKLQRIGAVRRIGSTQTGHWEVLN